MAEDPADAALSCARAAAQEERIAGIGSVRTAGSISHSESEWRPSYFSGSEVEMATKTAPKKLSPSPVRSANASPLVDRT